MKKKNNENKDDKLKFLKELSSTLAIAGVTLLVITIIVVYSTGLYKKLPFFKEPKEYTYNMFIQDLKADKIEKIETVSESKSAKIILKDDNKLAKEAELKSKFAENKTELKNKIAELNKNSEEEIKKLKEKNAKEFFEFEKAKKDRTKKLQIPTIESFAKLVQENIAEGINTIYEVKDIPGFTKFLRTFIGLLPTIILAILVILTFKMQGFGNNSKVYDPEENTEKVKFDDIAGLEEEKEQLIEVVEFLKDPSKYHKMGAKIPRGILLYGQPGTGKTLIAKAIAGEAKVAFLSMSGSEFIEMFAGLGAQRVRRLFEKARKHAPAIIFIDEIDAVGSRRTSSGNDGENNQTLNQLLVEMDGFNTEDNVIVLAATNRPEMLDKALLRPGRFDRQIVISTPDVKGREEILKLHGKNKKFDIDVDLSEIARNTAGFTGAELSNILNEAAILATKENKKAITMANIEEAIRKVTIGLKKENKIISEKEKRITAYHEAGHAIVSYMLETQEDVKEVTIIPRGMAGGYTMYKTSEDKSYLSKRQLEEDMIALMGGRAAEALIIKDITTGASNDIERATKIARNMITHYGMSEKLRTNFICGGRTNRVAFIWN